MRVAGLVLAVVYAPVALALAGPGGCVALILVVVGAAIVLMEAAQTRARNTTVESGARTGVEARPAACTDEALCWGRRFSHARLLRVTDADAVAGLAGQRQGYLDELERRHPARFEGFC